MAVLSGQAGLLCSPVTGNSGILGVFGYPVEHSLSPVMHNAAIAALGLHYIYIPFSVQPDDIGPAIRSLSFLGIIGVNLTIPHKERVLPFLDEIDPEALAIGAVNTVHNREGRLCGFNTDGEGFFRPLAASGFLARGKRVVVLGAGGAARSVVYRLLREGASVTIANRTRDRAERLAEQMECAAEGDVRVIDLQDASAMISAVGEAELLVNTTSLGLRSRDPGGSPALISCLHAGLTVYDLIYDPQETRLLADARAAGAKTINGVGMLVNQGAAAFKLWLATDPPINVMLAAVERSLAAKRDIAANDARML